MTSLSEISVFLLDGQATGATAEHGHLLELGWARARTGGDRSVPLPVEARVLRLPPGASVPQKVREITGLRTEDLEAGIAEERVWSELRQALAAAPAPTVIHCASYEMRFLTDLHRRLSPRDPNPIHPICTLQIARRLPIDIPRRGLRALAGYFGYGAGELRRVTEHVRATEFIWHHLVDRLAQRDVHTLEDLEAWLRRPEARRPLRRSYPMPKRIRLSVPDAPGVYRMLTSNRDVLYVGKATSLRSRVNSYFTKQSDLPERQLELLSQARDLDITVTPTILEAALLENEDIKGLDPPYNVALRAKDRQVWFSNATLDELSLDPSPLFNVGPMGSPWWLRRLSGLKEVIEGASLDETRRESLTQVVGSRIQRTPDDVLQASLLAFKERHPLRPWRPRLALREGMALWNRGFRGRSVSDDRVVEDTSNAPYNELEVLERLQEVLVTAAHAVRRGRWLTHLSEATVAYLEGGRWYGLTVREAQIGYRFTPSADHPLPIPPRGREPLPTRRRNFDLAALDRMRILSSELRRVVQNGQPARVRLNEAQELDGPRLRRLLALV